MVTRVPDYFEAFHCLAGACPHTCCAQWEVVVDPETAERYARETGPLGESLRAALREDADGDPCFPLDGDRCPFLDPDGLCRIHRELGEAATSVTCREHPRFTEDYGPFREVSLCASCPAANDLLLGNEAPLTFLERETADAEEEGDEWLEWLVPLRDQLLMLLEDRSRPLRERLTVFLEAAAEIQGELDGEEAEPGEDGGLFPGALRFLSELEELEPDWRELLSAGERAEAAPVPEALLERIAVYFAFRYLLKAVNDGDLLGRAEFCVLSVLTVQRLAALCGLSEALRRFCCEIEHSDENLEAVLEGFRRGEALSLHRLLQELDR